MLLLLLILALLIVVAGITLARAELRGRRIPLQISVLHGFAGMILVALLFWHDRTPPEHLLVNAATLFFGLTAAGGLMLFAFRSRGEAPPGFLIGMHASFAVVAVGLLIAGYVHG